MSTAQHVALALRKAALIERISAQRGHLAEQLEPLKKHFELADKIVRAGQCIKQHSWIAGIVAFATVVLGRRHLLSWAGRGWALWRGWRVASGWLRDNGYLKN